MKKKNIFFLLIITVILLIIIGLFYNTNNYKNTGTKSLLVTRIGENHAWLDYYGGIAIFNDGSIYKWEFSGKRNEFADYIGDYDIKTVDGLTDFIIDKGKKSSKKVSNSDLRNINKYIYKITDGNTFLNEDCHGADMGSVRLSIYKNKNQILINESGDCDRTSSSYNVIKLKSIISKYIQYYSIIYN